MRHPASKTPAKNSHAFTLIELLVVISIIALLIGILLPALGAARSVARISQSASNQRQIGIAMAAYQADNNEYFPLWQQDDLGQMVNGNIIWYWTTKLAADDYIPGLNIYSDPTFDADTSFLEPVAGARGTTNTGVVKANMNARVFNWIHYGYNFVWVGSNLAVSSSSRSAASSRDGLASSVPARVMDMDDATSVMVTSGTRDWNPSAKHTDSSTPTIDPTALYGAHVFMDYGYDVGNAGRPHARYNGSLQNAWADGHVSALAMPFTQEQQDATPNGYSGDAVRLYGADALGNILTWGSSGGRGGDDPGNYFDLHGDNPGL